MLGTAARQLSVGYKIVALLIVGEGQVRARTSKWNKLTWIWILKSESKISEICSYESLPVRTAAAAGRRNSSRPVHNSSFQFQSLLQDRENATLGHTTALKGLRFTNVLMIHCYTESALSYNGHKSSNIRRINVLWGTRTHWWIKMPWKSSLSMSHPTCYVLQLAVFMLISATALRVSVSHQTADSSWITPADYTPDFTSVWPCKLNYYYVFTAGVFGPLKMNSASVILFKKIHF